MLPLVLGRDRKVHDHLRVEEVYTPLAPVGPGIKLEAEHKRIDRRVASSVSQHGGQAGERREGVGGPRVDAPVLGGGDARPRGVGAVLAGYFRSRMVDFQGRLDPAGGLAGRLVEDVGRYRVFRLGHVRDTARRLLPGWLWREY